MSFTVVNLLQKNEHFKRYMSNLRTTPIKTLTGTLVRLGIIGILLCIVYCLIVFIHSNWDSIYNLKDVVYDLIISKSSVNEIEGLKIEKTEKTEINNTNVSTIGGIPTKTLLIVGGITAVVIVGGISVCFIPGVSEFIISTAVLCGTSIGL